MGDDLLSFKCEQSIFTTQLKAFHCFELATASLFCSALIFWSVGYECTGVCFKILHHHRWRTRKFDQEIPPSLGSKLCFTLYFHNYIFYHLIKLKGCWLANVYMLAFDLRFWFNTENDTRFSVVFIFDGIAWLII